MEVMEKVVVKVLEDIFINLFSDDLDKNQLHNIVSGKPVHTETKDSLINSNEKGQEMMWEYIQWMNRDNVTDSMMMGIIKK